MTVNQPQLETQREMPWMSASKVPAMVPVELLEKCKSRLDAIRLCVQLSNLANDTICEQLGIDKGHWSRMMQGRANFPDSKSVHLMQLCGNFAPMQFEAWKFGFQLRRPDLEQEIEDAESYVRQLKEKRARSTGINLMAAAA